MIISKCVRQSLSSCRQLKGAIAESKEMNAATQSDAVAQKACPKRWKHVSMHFACVNAQFDKRQ